MFFLTSFLALAAALAIFDLIMLEIGLEAPDSPGAVSACFFESLTSAGAVGVVGATVGAPSAVLGSGAVAGALAGAGVAGAGVAAGVAGAAAAGGICLAF